MSVKRYTIRYDIAENTGAQFNVFVKASDYDALASVCRALIGKGPKHMFHDEDDIIFQAAKHKALALLDGEKNEAKQ